MSALPAILAAGALGTLTALPAQAATELEKKEAMHAVDAVRHALPRGWEMTEIRWDTKPAGWTGPETCVWMKVEDTSMTFEHESGDFEYHPFYKVWLLPLAWEGRMEVAKLDADEPQAIYLGENDDFRVLYRTRGTNTWAGGPEDLAQALEVEAYPLSHRPVHELDVGAMQRLLERLQFAAGEDSDRWTRQIYAIAELPDMLYVELLTWDERRGEEEDLTSLGRVAEIETRFLSREVLAAFPGKNGLYLRRVTNRSFSDVIVVNPSLLAMESSS